jgi:TonB-linked SusC/RagA family outer membrane protein
MKDSLILVENGVDEVNTKRSTKLKMKNHLFWKSFSFRTVLSIALLFVIPQIFAQTTDSTSVESNVANESVSESKLTDTLWVEGYIKDTITNDPVVGATVIIKSTGEGAATDENGKFTIVTQSKLPLTLHINYNGVIVSNKDVEITSLTAAGLVIPLRTTELQKEVVIVGYGTKSRRELVGSIAKVNAEEVKDIPVASVDAQLQGKAPGVQINSTSGMPGESVRIRVRGSTSIYASNDPLYIVDGVYVNNNSLQQLQTGVTGNGVAGGINQGEKSTSPLADIPPSDIESIEVLKDASATAIYGSRAANGVVIITTKRGYWDNKPKVNFNTSIGFAYAPKNRLWKVATGPEHAEIVNEQWINSGIDNPSLNQTAANVPFQRAPDDTYNPGSKTYRGNPSDQGTYSDTRLNQVFRTAMLKSYDLSVQGGSKTTRYYLGGSYTFQEAILKPADFTRAAFKANFDSRISKRIQVGTSNLISRSFRHQVRAGNGPDAGILQSALQTPSYLPTNAPDGTPLRWANFDNTQVLIDNPAQTTSSLRYIGNVYLEAEVLPRLKFRTSWGADYNYYRAQEYYNTNTQIGAATNGEAKSNLTQLTGLVNEQTLSYTTNITDKHNFGILVGNTLQTSYYNFDALAGTGFPNNSFTQISAAANKSAAQSKSQNALASFFSRVNYNHDGRYYVEATVRADGSSKFGANHRWGYFPAIGAAWRAKNERFLEDVSWLTDLKVRGSWGILGNQNGINDFASRGLWTGGAAYPNAPGGADQPGTVPLQLSNPDLKWEKTTQTNFGVDVAFFKGRLVLETNIYKKYTRDALLNLPVPSSTGYSTYQSNAGEISNKGYEIALTSVNIENRNFSWTTTFNISGNKNKIEKLDVPITFYSRDWLIDKQGYSMYSFWLYKQLYVDPANGNAVFQKADGTTTASAPYSNNVTVTSADRVVMGNAMPKFFGGLTNNFKFKGFDLGVFVTYQYGNKLINYNKFLGEKAGTNGYAGDGRFILESQMDRWTHPGQVTDVPRVTSQGNNYLVEQNSRFLEDGSFIRLKTLTLGYTLPKSVISFLRVEKLRVYAMGTNLFLITKYTGPDPEINVTSDQNAPGLDQGTPPQPRSFLFGINLTL